VEPEDELKKLFTLFDDTKTGFIGAPTLRRICKSLNLHI
jgi:Ca2+-binding EF-hand superfamily protein